MGNVPSFTQMDAPVIYQISEEALKRFANELVQKTKQEIENRIRESQSERYLSREATAKMLGVDCSTLYRWAQRGYLVPSKIGNQVRYKESEIRKKLEER